MGSACCKCYNKKTESQEQEQDLVPPDVIDNSSLSIMRARSLQNQQVPEITVEIQFFEKSQAMSSPSREVNVCIY